MTDTSLATALEQALGYRHPALATVAEMDPPLAAEFLKMAEAVRATSALSVKDRALINIALNAAVVHLNANMIRAHIAAALGAGATAGEIREVLQLTSVLGIHGTLPGAEILTEEEGGPDRIRASADPDRKARAAAAKAAFEAVRGPLTPAWENCTWHCPDLVAAYAGFSGVPWATDHLSPKMKELIYIAIDILPQHFHTLGTRHHMRKARAQGATEAEIVSVLQEIALFGFQTHLAALPVLKEELERIGAPG